MKVLQINSVCGYGSTGKISYDLCKVLESNGHECVVAYGRGNAPKDIKSIKIGTNKDVKVHGVASRITDKHGLYSKNATKRFIKQIQKYDPDIIHLHNIHGYYINVELLFDYLYKADKKVIWTLHDCWAFTGHCSYFDYVGCDRWKEECHNCPQKYRYHKSLFFDNSRRNYQMKKQLFTSVKNMTIVTPSNWLANLVKQSFLSKYPVKVIYNGINLDVFKPTPSDFRKKYNLENKFIVLGVASVWEERKGLNDFIQLSKVLSERYRVVLVGLSKKQKDSLPENVVGITRTSNATELAQIYTAANVFVNTTYEDNFPTTNIEALACGIPIITYDTGGSVESANDSCGIIVEKGNIQMLAKKVMDFDSNYFISKNCIERAKLFDKECRFLEYLYLYVNE